jgi:hypothetical protein
VEIVFIGSSIGLGGIVLRKIPELISLPDVVPEPETESFVAEVRARIGQIGFLKKFSPEILLQKILTKIRILSLKTDNKTSDLIQKLNDNSQKKKIKQDDNYWKKVKKATRS